jgi:hypothetical protein
MVLHVEVVVKLLLHKIYFVLHFNHVYGHHHLSFVVLSDTIALFNVI